VSEVIRIKLTDEQSGFLAPLVLAAASRHENIVFVATAAPSQGDWHLQVITAPATLGQKLRKLLLTGVKR
jgi:hypothetical protein